MKTLDEAMQSFVTYLSDAPDDVQREQILTEFDEFAKRHQAIFDEINANESVRHFVRVAGAKLDIEIMKVMSRSELPAKLKHALLEDAMLAAILQAFANGVLIGIQMEQST